MEKVRDSASGQPTLSYQQQVIPNITSKVSEWDQSLPKECKQKGAMEFFASLRLRLRDLRVDNSPKGAWAKWTIEGTQYSEWLDMSFVTPTS